MSDQNHAPDDDESASGEGPRELPESPSLRYLRLEAKRRLAAGGFPTLHDAQLALAREHGMSSWTALKQHIETEGETVPAATSDAESEPVLRQLRWLFDRFADLGLLGVIVAGDRDAGSTRETWTHARGWADLNQGIAMRPEHRFPACTVTELVTAIAVLRLVDEGELTLDGRVNSRLRSLRLADDEVTVRQLLTHSGGVDGPESLWADAPVDPVELYGEIVGCSGARGTFTYSRGGYAVLGQLVAELTGATYTEAVTRLVLEPLGMGDSSFPAELPKAASDADDGRVRGHRLDEEGTFEREPERHFVFRAAGGLWSTARDLLRLAVGWQRLLTEELAAEALRPQVRAGDRASSIGLGWMLRPDLGFAGHNGHCPGSAVSLILKPGEARAGVVYTNRTVPIERVNAQIMRR
jgi:CubicO group peptidase (beta-lactamase class C family)